MSDGRRREFAFLASPNLFLKMQPAIITVIYAVAGIVWIFYSDNTLARLAVNYGHYQELQTYKGWLFVAISSSILYVALRSAWRVVCAAYESLRDSEGRLNLALSSAHGGIWERNIAEGQDAISFVSPHLADKLGLAAPDELTSEEWWKRLHPDDREAISYSFRMAVDSGGDLGYDVRYRIRANDGEYRWVHSRASIVKDAHGNAVRMIGVALDITQQMIAEERVQQLLRYDPLTGLPNRSTLRSQLDDLIGTSVREGKMFSLIKIRVLDLHDLHHDVENPEGQQVLREVGDHLSEGLGEDVLVARVSTDVFAIATSPTAMPELLQGQVIRLLDLLAAPLVVDGKRTQLRFAVGAALFPQDGEDVETLMLNARHALTKANRANRADVQWFTEGLDTEFEVRRRRLQDLRNAVHNAELECHFQPIVDLVRGETIGYEALARWRRPDEGLVPPDQFIGLAEEHGYICDIGKEILRQACTEAVKWKGNDNCVPFVAVNVSPLQLNDPGFTDVVQTTLKGTGLAPNRLELEVTENAVADDPELAAQHLEQLRALGVSIAIDDFGTGHSSLSTLSKLPFTRLKIDQSFVSGYGMNDGSTIIVDAIIGLCHALDLSMTAEGVETVQQAARLRAMGVEYAQGYYFSPPVACERVEAFAGRKWPIDGKRQFDQPLRALL